jgi:N-acetylneuraminate synthase
METRMNTPAAHLDIQGRLIGPGHAPYVIAEISANHNGDIRKALRLIEEAQRAGAHAVKLQTYTPDTITLDSDAPDFCIRGGLWDGRTLYDLYREAHMPWDWHKPLFDHARQTGITIIRSDGKGQCRSSDDTKRAKKAVGQLIGAGIS